MTKAEFEEEVGRVLVALGMDSSTAFEVEVSPHHKDAFKTRIQGASFQCSIGCSSSRSGLVISDDLKRCKKVGYVAYVYGFPQLAIWKDRKHVPLMLRVLFRLGYDVDAIGARSGISITAHEKLEWHLERQDREKNSPPKRGSSFSIE